MRTIAVILIALLTAPTGVFAQELSTWGAVSVTTPKPGFLREAIAREEARAAQEVPSVPPSGEVPHRSWVARHPVAFGALTGSAFPVVGTTIGACVGHLASARQKKYDAAASTQLDIAGVKGVVAVLGRGKEISVTKANGDHASGNISGIGGHAFSLLPEGQSASVQIAYADVRTVRGKPMSAGAKAGIVACTIGQAVGQTLLWWGLGGIN